MMPLKATLLALFFSIDLTPGHCQHPPVAWNFKADYIRDSEWMITLTATLAPEWHIYSQFIEEGGPVPTNIALHHSDDYISLGKAEERGSAVKFYDSLYEMEVVWYTGKITFLQGIRLRQLIPSIKGTVDYMVCNNHQCIPYKEEFQINIQPFKRTP